VRATDYFTPGERGQNDTLQTADTSGHAFIRARRGELNVSWDRVDDQSQIDRSMAMSSPIVDAGG